jgi:hypothetical protein
MRCLSIVAALVLLPSASTTWADDEQPRTQPTRDVDISYNISRPRHPTTIERRRWLAGERLERVDGLDNSSTIFDHSKSEITVLNTTYRTYTKLEGTPRQPVQPKAGTLVERRGETMFAGLHCIEWSWTSHAKMHTACLTSDGVLLRFAIDGHPRIEARSVRYQAQQPELFQVPPNYSPALTSEGGLER